MSDYHRTTRECFVNQLHPELLQAIQEYKLRDLETETFLCCETISTRKHFSRLVSWLKGKLDAKIYIAMLLTSQQFIWVKKGDQTDTVLTTADLRDIQVRAYTSAFTEDGGLEIFGYIDGFKGRVRGYIGMGPEVEAQNFCEEVGKAITNATPPTQKKLPKWLGG